MSNILGYTVRPCVIAPTWIATLIFEGSPIFFWQAYRPTRLEAECAIFDMAIEYCARGYTIYQPRPINGP